MQHTRCFPRYILQASPQYSAFPWLLIPYSSYACAYFVSRRHWWDRSTVKRQLSDNHTNSKHGLKSDAKWVTWERRASWLGKNPMSRKMSSKQFHNSLLEQFREFIYSSSPQMQNKNVTTLKKFRPCLRS